MQPFERLGFVLSRGVMVTWFGVAAVGLLACSSTDEKREAVLGQSQSALIPLEPPTSVEAGTVTPRAATCPQNQLPDQCGSWAGVELRASRDAGKATAQAAAEASHCLCQGIDFQIPASLPVTSGQAGWDWDKPVLSFRKPSGSVVECRYRGNGTPKGTGGSLYTLDRCTDGFTAGQTAHSDWFELDLGAGHPQGRAVQVSLRLGAPDVVGGVVQEQVFYSSDPRIAGAALHVPRGSAPPFETFSLEALTQVPPGTALQGGGAAVTSAGYAVDVHSDTSDTFAFAPVAGAACPRVDLPYDQATLERLVGPGHEAALHADQLLTLTNITDGSDILASTGPVTVNLAQRTLSFCVEHLSFYVADLSGYIAGIRNVQIVGDGLDRKVGGPGVGSLPLLRMGAEYTLTFTFDNLGTSLWDETTRLVPVTVSYPTPQTFNANATADGNPAWNPTDYEYSWTTAEPVPAKTSTVTSTGEVSLKITAPSNPALQGPLNFCLAHNSSFFEVCFSWDTAQSGGGTIPVAFVEVCDGLDNDLDTVRDNGADEHCYTGTDGTEGHGECVGGAYKCVGGNLGNVCEGQVTDRPEICNGKDDDCDDFADDNIPDRDCYDGPGGTEGVAGCHGGKQICAGGDWRECMGQVLPAAEICDGVDNDCNNQTDEGCPFDFGYSKYLFDLHYVPGVPADGRYSGQVCPAGEFADGIIGRSGALVDGVGLTCAQVQLTTDTSTTPYTYNASWVGHRRLPPQGGAGGGFSGSECGWPGLMTGVRLHQGDLTVSIGAQCARLGFDHAANQVYETEPRYWAGAYGGMSQEDPQYEFGGAPSGDALEYVCPPGEYVNYFYVTPTTYDEHALIERVFFGCGAIGVRK